MFVVYVFELLMEGKVVVCMMYGELEIEFFVCEVLLVC